MCFTDNLWLNDNSFLWANTLHDPLLKYTIYVEGKNKVLKEHVILPKAGHSRLTMAFVQDNLEPAYDITYSGRKTEIYQILIFFTKGARDIKFFSPTDCRLLFWTPPFDRLDFVRLGLQQSFPGKRGGLKVISKELLLID